MASRRSSVPRVLVSAAAGYLIGTFPTADLVTKAVTRGSTDLREEGSGNPGALNAMQVVGARAGLVVMAVDIGKGALAAGVGRRLAAGPGANLAGTASVVGHCYPVWNGFRGGKGVAASIGQVLVTFPVYFPIDLTVAAVTAAAPGWKQRAFAANTVASAAWVGGSVVWWRKGWRNGWGPEIDVTLPLSTLASSLVIYGRFRAAERLGRELAELAALADETEPEPVVPGAPVPGEEAEAP